MTFAQALYDACTEWTKDWRYERCVLWEAGLRLYLTGLPVCRGVAIGHFPGYVGAFHVMANMPFGPIPLAIAPTRALAHEIAEAISKPFVDLGIVETDWIGGETLQEVEDALREGLRAARADRQTDESG